MLGSHPTLRDGSSRRRLATRIKSDSNLRIRGGSVPRPTALFRRTRRWKYRRAVGTHYGPTRIHQADYSPRHRRDGRAGTTILYHLRICRRAEPLQGATTGRTGLREYGATPSYPPGQQDLSGTTGRAGAADAAADAAGAAVPYGDYGPDGAADGLSQEYPATSGRHYHATFLGAGRRVSPMYGTRSQQHVRRGLGRVPLLLYAKILFYVTISGRAVWDWNIRTT
jgi:hypothetical protein